MPNPYFRFKQFTVWQKHQGLRVSTEACLLGAITQVSNTNQNILDIGAGTGLLSLMLAQKAGKAKIDAVEIDPDAQKQCLENFQLSPWHKRLQLFGTSLQHFYHKQTPESYDCIISNPPFFAHHSPSPQKARQLALHQSQLSLEELYEAIVHLLSDDGLFWLLLPPFEMQQFQNLASGLHLHKVYHIFNRLGKPLLRKVCAFGKQKSEQQTDFRVISIRNPDTSYSSEFRHLLQPYYLIF